MPARARVSVDDAHLGAAGIGRLLELRLLLVRGVVVALLLGGGAAVVAEARLLRLLAEDLAVALDERSKAFKSESICVATHAGGQTAESVRIARALGGGASARHAPLAAAAARVSAAVASARWLRPRICGGSRRRAAEAQGCAERARRVAHGGRQ